jgi:hypothetical protein
VKKALMVAALFMTVGCIDIPAMNGLIDRIVPEESRNYQTIEVWSVEGDFAPNPDQGEGTVLKAIEDILRNPAEFQNVIQSLSWEKYEHTFVIESEWNAKFAMLLLSVNYDTLGGTDLEEGPAGTLNISIRDPNGGEHAEGYEMVTWNNGISERPYLLPPIYGIWTIVISGSGFEGAGSFAYSGDYSIKVESERLV